MGDFYIIKFLGRNNYCLFSEPVREHTIRVELACWPDGVDILKAITRAGYVLRALRSITAEGV